MQKYLGARSLGTRNRVIHGYMGIDNDIIWNIIQKSPGNMVSVHHAARGLREGHATLKALKAVSAERSSWP